MKAIRTVFRIFIFFLLVCSPTHIFAQVHVLLDHWYNHEVSSKTGQPFHYLWTDTLNSGFSQFGEIFISNGGVVSMLEKPANAKDLSGADIYIIVDPDTTSENPSPNYISDKSAKAIAKWVKRGGVLLLMANDGPNC
ncbi:MAG TPA: DUF4350 domain-containing protein, partial [Bacteroidales bacterium]|nr:DUF4350 domain-containing protein [Bacteroidales bacterium]